MSNPRVHLLCQKNSNTKHATLIFPHHLPYSLPFCVTLSICSSFGGTKNIPAPHRATSSAPGRHTVTSALLTLIALARTVYFERTRRPPRRADNRTRRTFESPHPTTTWEFRDDARAAGRDKITGGWLAFIHCGACVARDQWTHCAKRRSYRAALYCLSGRVFPVVVVVVDTGGLAARAGETGEPG